MKEQEVLRIVEWFAKKLPKSSDGRIDYSGSKKALVITVFVKYKNEILLLKRSQKVDAYQGKWNSVSGYFDEVLPVREKILEEIEEELGIGENNILLIRLGRFYHFTDNDEVRTWIIFPTLVELKNKPKIKLDWEHTEYKWIKFEEMRNFDTVPNLKESLKNAMEESSLKICSKTP